MNSTTVAVDLAKNVFEVAVAGADWRVCERHRLNRARFAAFFVHRSPCLVVLEACGSAHYWARRIAASGHEVRLLPAQYVRAYVRRNKTDRADAAALIEAVRCADIRPVPVKTLEQQQVLALHRLRSQWMSSRQRCINTLRGLLREFGVPIALGVTVAKSQIGAVLADTESEVPAGVRPALGRMLEEVTALEQRIDTIEGELAALTRSDERVQQMRAVPGIGLLTSTALRATVGDIQRFPSGRHFASWLGLTAREYSSAEHRRLSGSPSAATSICERCSCTVRALRCWQRIGRNARDEPWTGSDSGHWTVNDSVVTTRPPSRSPIVSRASSGRPGSLNEPSTATGRDGRPEPFLYSC